MKTNVQVYVPPKGSEGKDVPPEMASAREVVVHFTTAYMRMFGVKKVSANYTSFGAKTVMDVSFKSMAATPPEGYEKSKSFAVRNITEMMSLFGIMEIEILPDMKDMDVIINNWEDFKGGIQDGDPMDTRPTDIPDPTTESVLDGGK